MNPADAREPSNGDLRRDRGNGITRPPPLPLSSSKQERKRRRSEATPPKDDYRGAPGRPRHNRRSNVEDELRQLWAAVRRQDRVIEENRQLWREMRSLRDELVALRTEVASMRASEGGNPLGKMSCEAGAVDGVAMSPEIELDSPKQQVPRETADSTIPTAPAEQLPTSIIEEAVTTTINEFQLAPPLPLPSPIKVVPEVPIILETSTSIPQDPPSNPCKEETAFPAPAASEADSEADFGSLLQEIMHIQSRGARIGACECWKELPDEELLPIMKAGGILCLFLWLREDMESFRGPEQVDDVKLRLFLIKGIGCLLKVGFP